MINIGKWMKKQSQLSLSLQFLKELKKTIGVPLLFYTTDCVPQVLDEINNCSIDVKNKGWDVNFKMIPHPSHSRHALQ